jgi:hypothetical protein
VDDPQPSTDDPPSVPRDRSLDPGSGELAGEDDSGRVVPTDGPASDEGPVALPKASVPAPDPEEPYRRRQFENWSVCQICGRCRARGTVGWLDAPYRFRGQHHGPNFNGSKHEWLRIVRCPQHWSVWALRHSIGRSKRNMLLMKAVKEWAATQHWCNPYIEPFPISDWPNPIPRDQWWADWERGIEPWLPSLEMSLRPSRKYG